MMPFDLDAMRAMHFGQHMQPTRESVSHQVEVRMLEAWFDADLKCEAVVHASGECAVEATHHVRDCVGDGLVCKTVAVYVQRAIDRDVLCECGERVSTHVRLVAL